MFPEEKEGERNDADETAVIIDLSKKVDEQEAPVTTAAADDTTGNDDANKDGGGEGGEGTAHSDTTAVDDEEFKTTGRKDFDKRLKREMRQKLEARGQAAAATLAQQEADHRAEEAERLLEEERAQRRAEPVVVNTADLDAKILAAQGKLTKAHEDGESATIAALQVEISDLTSQKAVRVAAPPRREPPKPQQRPAPKTNGITATGKAFVTANSVLWNDPKRAAVKAAVIAIDGQLIAEGSDPNSEAHYGRIAKRLKEQGITAKLKQPFGDDMGIDDDADDTPAPRRGTAPQGGNGSGRQNGNAEVRDARAGKIVLNDRDREVMRTFKLDPNNPKHLREFAQARRERLLEGAQS